MGHSQADVGKWAIGLFRGKALNSLSANGSANPIISFRDFKAWNGSAVADPFAIRYQNAWYVFFELFQNGTDKAIIGASRSSDLVVWEPLGIVLEQPHHLSYPFVFEHEGEIYMMPESKSVRRLDIFRAVDFPTRWVFEKTILRGSFADCSMVFHNHRYWIFAAWRGSWLRLFHAPHPLGPWSAHAWPFIRTYSKVATRPGGRPRKFEDMLVRFSQDNTLYYGQQLWAWNITSMNRIWYSDKQLYDAPILKGSGDGWNARCMHHIDCFDGPSTGDAAGQRELMAFVDGCA
jgi:hypothetical protein